MRIAALGDAHLGRTLAGVATVDGVNQREIDFEESFLDAVRTGLDAQPDLFVWLGDVFDHPRPNYRSFRVVMEALRMIRDHGIGLVAITGNHDTPRLPGVGSPYGVLADAFPEFHFAFRMAYETVDRPGLRVHCVPQARTNEDSVAALHEAGENRSPDRVNLLLTHPLVHGVERRYPDMNEIEVDATDLRADLVLLGHYHTYQRILDGVWYAGATDTFSFGDEPRIAKGLVLLDTDQGSCTHVALTGQRPLVSPRAVDAWGKGASEITDEITERLAKVAAGAVVRLDLDGIDTDVYRLLDIAGITSGAGHLAHLRLVPLFRSATNSVQDLPELASIGARWREYVGTQQTEQFDAARLSRLGEQYLEAAIDVAADPSTD